MNLSISVCEVLWDPSREIALQWNIKLHRSLQPCRQSPSDLRDFLFFPSLLVSLYKLWFSGYKIICSSVVRNIFIPLPGQKRGQKIERNTKSFVARVIFIINSATIYGYKERTKVTVLNKYIGWDNSGHCYSYCMLPCSSLSEWLCEIAIDVREYFHHSLLTHILGWCFYSGLLLLALIIWAVYCLLCMLITTSNHPRTGIYLSWIRHFCTFQAGVDSWIFNMPRFILRDWNHFRNIQCCTQGLPWVLSE